MNSRQQIGFSQRIRLEWLEHTANLVGNGNGPSEINDSLQDLLSDQLSVGGTAKRGNREKAITILLKTWVTVSQDLQPLRDDGISLLNLLPAGEHLLVHWGMCSATYPFWASVADVTGRLLRLQDEAAASQIQRRLKEQYGERETVARAARRVLRAFADWEVLAESDRKGVYVSGHTIMCQNHELALWVLEAMLQASSSPSISQDALRQLPALFPFEIEWPGTNEIEKAPRLQVYRQGMADDIIELRT